MDQKPPVTENILRIISWKKDRLRTVGLDARGILLPPEDYQSLKDELEKRTGSTGNPDRLMGLPLYAIDAAKTSSRTGLPREPMVIL